MTNKQASLLVAATFFLTWTIHARAESENKPADATEIIPVWPGVAPGSEKALWKEIVDESSPKGGNTLVRNVVKPTLTVFLPDRSKSSGTAIIIAPGGGFRWLSIDAEGYNVAREMQAHGIAAFVLKYRLAPTPDDDTQFQDFAKTFVARLMAHPITKEDDLGSDAPLAVADGLQAIKVVRSNAAHWGIDPKRIGIIGFSAGGQVANSVATRYAAASRPDFVAAIYGIPSNSPVPKDAPPLFLGTAADDPLVEPGTDIALFEKWKAAGRVVELHVFTAGGHGFGNVKQGTTSDHWFDELKWWLGSQGLVQLDK